MQKLIPSELHINMGVKTVKFLEDSIEEYLYNLREGHNLLNGTQ